MQSKRACAVPTPVELDGVDALSLSAFGALRDAMRTNAHAMARCFAATGGHPGQAACLRVLDRNDGVSQRELAEILHVSPPSISSMLQAVEKSGAIVRRPDGADQRITRVYLTEAGRLLAAEQRRVLAEYVNATVARLPEDDRRELVRILAELTETIERASQAGTAATEQVATR
jgi:MarR family transcriptional regulator, organic hydroperoxide resistance regulator